jgi:hypothetical protein
MTTTRRRRIVRWTAVALVSLVLLLSSYVSLFCIDRWNTPPIGLPAPRTGLLGSRFRVPDVPDWVFEPLHDYAEADLPGGVELMAAGLWCQFRGDVQWKQIHGWVAKRHDDARPQSAR